MKLDYIFSLALLVLLLVENVYALEDNSQVEFCSNENEYYYCLFYENTLEQHIGEEGFPIFTTKKIHREKRSTDYALQLYNGDYECTSNQLGVTTFQGLHTEDVLNQWGKVDYLFDYTVTEIKPDCRPYFAESTYLFCSQKNDKTVIICLQQQTDNPQLAQEIFSTFRWIEEEPLEKSWWQRVWGWFVSLIVIYS